ncbi:MAG: ATP-binding protein [Elusimicrobiales bacterium]|nr:ATP-binding protein [Elusimicrobiales bacterium]
MISESVRKPYKIALISTHGTGKTTLCFEVAAMLKKLGLKVKVFSEIATQAFEQGIPINEKTTLPAQLFIMMQHISEELRADIREYEVVICDRSVFDNLVYMERRCGRQNFVRSFIKDYSEKFPYDVIYKLPLVGELTEDGIREAHNQQFQEDIYKMLNETLAEMNVKHVTLDKPVSEMRREWAERIVKDTLEAIHWEEPARQLALFKGI